MRVDILTIFPEMFKPLEESIIKRARDKGLLSVNVIDIREYTQDKHRKVDDYPFGGGAGMVMKPEPLFRAVENACDGENIPVVLLTPQGETFTQEHAQQLSRQERLILVCGHYEGVDERFRERIVSQEISIGDYVLTGGELPAMVLVDAVTRLLPGALGDDSSSQEDSFAEGLLEYPQYTRPRSFRDMEVPQVLLSGNHEAIRYWRRKMSLARTDKRRPDLLEKKILSPEDRKLLMEIKDTPPNFGNNNEG
ncbi:tRNA (guanosine(37)-N1)-methyltransferase TrmD [Metallumcola ferriviriculae]|uniref:tRNA (guanine-N(1)-)-methyltransferase n=2 Tax=Metallumcola ferriviriculae TaxID=3039180 RepID=A0AAU0UPC0_9FIRM|nr:tRNA (guanosine(37)-N1)-methyltransferase TrmD [Desulfitibacteraceae bacterium MK1]